MAEAEQSYDVSIEAGAQECVDVLLDFERYPEWSSPILEVRIEALDDAGHGHHVAFAFAVAFTFAITFALALAFAFTLTFTLQF